MEKKSIGKNTLGGGSKMDVVLHGYNRSTHDLSFAWRSTAGVGTLIPCLKLVGLPGDTFDINIDSKILTHPTVGPLFGSYKVQIDIFSCPFRLYNAKLHNNALNIGMDISKVKLPKLRFKKTTDNEPLKYSQSSLLAYLGVRGAPGNLENYFEINATPILAYLDIFKNYYANKQEDNAYYLSRERYDATNKIDRLVYNNEGYATSGAITASFGIYDETNTNDFEIEIGASASEIEKVMLPDEFSKYFTVSKSGLNYILSLRYPLPYKGKIVKVTAVNPQKLVDFQLDEIDTIREDILAENLEYIISTDTAKKGKLLPNIANEQNYLKPGALLLIKTHQSDIFNNWVKKEWVEGENGINKITAIDTSSGSFTLDTLNLAKKVYNMLNRIAVSGGTYRDWVETVYDIDFSLHTETPTYEGGYSNEIEFEEVVSNSATIIANEEQPLGTLAGRGRTSDRIKGGQLHIKVKEPSYIIGILSITPRVDYCQGNEWDMTNVKTLDDLHKPQLDGIGWQDLLASQMMFWKGKNIAVGKQPAWINYMTNYNKTFGAFAEDGNENFMVLNKWYDENNMNVPNSKAETTSYIDPSKFNYIFADTNVDAQNFWVQIGYGIKARRVMSAKQIPLM